MGSHARYRCQFINFNGRIGDCHSFVEEAEGYFYVFGIGAALFNSRIPQFAFFLAVQGRFLLPLTLCAI